MSACYQFGEFKLDPKLGEVRHLNQRIKIRPKTCLLLTYLLEANGNIVSKEALMAQVWDDVSVDEQVVFQSIKELRKVFQGIDVIKTHPRKGYSWLIPVKKITSTNQTVSNSDATSVKSKPQYWIAAILAVVLIIGFYWLSYTENTVNPPMGSIVILPVKTSLKDSDHRWVRYGAMDQLIQSLRSSATFTVMQTEDVLDIMKRASTSLADYTREDINQIFKVSGASLVVEQTLTGSPRDYQLIYSIHRKNQTDRGALLAEHINDAVSQLSDKLRHQLGQELFLDHSAYRSEFANEMLASALESIQAEDFEAAAQLLQATVTTEPDNLIAKRLLIQVLVTDFKFEKVNQLIKGAIDLANTKQNTRELSRLQFWAGVNHIQQKHWEQGLTFLNKAKNNAEEINDWLYLGYVAEATGKTYQAQKKYKKAHEEFRSSLDYHQIIQCPNGYANGLLNLGALALLQGKQTDALSRFKESLALAKQRGLIEIEKNSQFWLDKASQEKETENRGKSIDES